MVHIRTYKNVMFTANEKHLLEKRIEEDCVECKYIGSAVFTGLGGYLFYLRMNTPKNAVSQRLFLAVFGTALFGVAGYRLVEFNQTTVEKK